MDPFTGCFITPIPATLALLRLALHLLDSDIHSDERDALITLAGERLPDWIQHREKKAEELKNIWNSERLAWDSYYAALDKLEKALSNHNPEAVSTAGLFKDILKNCRIA